MKLVDLTIQEFSQVLGSDAPAPGGGSAAALSAANGISLTKMVCELTLGKARYAEHDLLIRNVHEQAILLQQQLLEAIDKDTEAFNLVSAVFTMPKETVEDKEKRKSAMQIALKKSAQSPYDMMGLILKSLEITKEAVGKSNTNAASDLGVAALNLKAGLQGAWLNVLINLSGIRDDEFVRTYKNQGEALLASGMLLADAIYQDILADL